MAYLLLQVWQMQLAISFAPVLIRAEAQLLPPWTTLESSLVGRCAAEVGWSEVQKDQDGRAMRGDGRKLAHKFNIFQEISSEDDDGELEKERRGLTVEQILERSPKYADKFLDKVKPLLVDPKVSKTAAGGAFTMLEEPHLMPLLNESSKSVQRHIRKCRTALKQMNWAMTSLLAHKDSPWRGLEVKGSLAEHGCVKLLELMKSGMAVGKFSEVHEEEFAKLMDNLHRLYMDIFERRGQELLKGAIQSELDVIYLLPESGGRFPDGSRVLLQDLSARADLNGKAGKIVAWSAIGGMLIGLSAAISYLVDGRIAGVAGILGPFLRGVTQCQPLKDGQLWKILFLLGLVLGGLIAMACNHDFSFPRAAPFHVVRYIAAAIFVGIGTRVGKGCTSGHGICGLPRFSSRSWVAVPTFMGCAIVTVALTRHGFQWDQPGPWAVAELQWPPKWEFPVASLVACVLLTGLVLLLPMPVRSYASPTLAGIIFGVGLGCAGMTSQAKVLDFLDFGGTWDPSLAFVMGCGILVSGPAFLYAEREASKPLCSDCSYEKPPKHGNYPPLIFGASFFGLGWGLIGICPGPAVAGVIPYLVDGDGPGFSFGLSFLVICITWLITDRVVVKLERAAAAQALPKAAQPSDPKIEDVPDVNQDFALQRYTVEIEKEEKKKDVEAPANPDMFGLGDVEDEEEDDAEKNQIELAVPKKLMVLPKNVLVDLKPPKSQLERLVKDWNVWRKRPRSVSASQDAEAVAAALGPPLESMANFLQDATQAVGTGLATGRDGAELIADECRQALSNARNLAAKLLGEEPQ
ncbi:unnamed protein product, partial [Symbiodinium microadriaticum]